MGAKKYYAVQKGKIPGVYETWAEAQAQINGFSGAIYKAFSNEADAHAFLEKDGYVKQNEIVVPLHAYAFVDGSFNPATGAYGCGGYFVHPAIEHTERKKEIIMKTGNDMETASMRNVAGEMIGAMIAVSLAKKYGYHELTIFYDYEGICAWVEETWKTNKKQTAQYAEYMRKAQKDGIIIHFVHTKGHSGISGNEEADKLAKKAVGII